jgi:hypothetical protein
MDILSLVKAGRVFTGSTTYAGVTIPIYSATSGHKFCLWNPAGSQRLIVPLSLNISQSDATTPAITGLAFVHLNNAGSVVATGAPVAAWTDTAPQALPGSQGSSYGARFSLAADLTAAGTLSYVIGLSQDSATPGTGVVNLTHKFDQSYAIFPNALVSLVGAPLAFGQDVAATITWAELDL